MAAIKSNLNSWTAYLLAVAHSDMPGEGQRWNSPLDITCWNNAKDSAKRTAHDKQLVKTLGCIFMLVFQFWLKVFLFVIAGSNYEIGFPCRLSLRSKVLARGLLSIIITDIRTSGTEE